MTSNAVAPDLLKFKASPCPSVLEEILSVIDMEGKGSLSIIVTSAISPEPISTKLDVKV